MRGEVKRVNLNTNNQGAKPKKINKSDTSQYNLTKEEVAESVIRSLKDAHRFLRGEIELRSINELLKEADEYIDEEKKNGRF